MKPRWRKLKPVLYVRSRPLRGNLTKFSIESYHHFVKNCQNFSTQRFLSRLHVFCFLETRVNGSFKEIMLNYYVRNMTRKQNICTGLTIVFILPFYLDF